MLSVERVNFIAVRFSSGQSTADLIIPEKNNETGLEKTLRDRRNSNFSISPFFQVLDGPIGELIAIPSVLDYDKSEIESPA